MLDCNTLLRKKQPGRVLRIVEALDVSETGREGGGRCYRFHWTGFYFFIFRKESCKKSPSVQKYFSPHLSCFLQLHWRCRRRCLRTLRRWGRNRTRSRFHRPLSLKARSSRRINSPRNRNPAIHPYLPLTETWRRPSSLWVIPVQLPVFFSGFILV